MNNVPNLQWAKKSDIPKRLLKEFTAYKRAIPHLGKFSKKAIRYVWRLK
jgi:hypothetical protein